MKEAAACFFHRAALLLSLCSAATHRSDRGKTPTFFISGHLSFLLFRFLQAFFLNLRLMGMSGCNLFKYFKQ